MVSQLIVIAVGVKIETIWKIGSGDEGTSCTASNDFKIYLSLKCNKTKQWLLAGEFSEFEYSRKTRRFWRVRVLAKTAVF
jgi:hypothetical protein